MTEGHFILPDDDKNTYCIMMVYEQQTDYNKSIVERYKDMFEKWDKPLEILDVSSIIDMFTTEETPKFAEYVSDKMNNGISILIDTPNSSRDDRTIIIVEIMELLNVTEDNEFPFKFICETIISPMIRTHNIDIPNIITEAFDVIDYSFDSDIARDSYRYILERESENLRTKKLHLISDKGEEVVVPVFEIIDELHEITHEFTDEICLFYDNGDEEWIPYSLSRMISSLFNGVVMNGRDDYINTFKISGVVQLIYQRIDKIIYSQDFFITRDEDDYDVYSETMLACAIQYMDVMYIEANKPGNIYRDLKGDDFEQYFWGYSYVALPPSIRDDKLPGVVLFGRFLKIAMVIINTYFYQKFGISNVGKIFTNLGEFTVDKFYKCKCSVKDEPIYIDYFEDVYMSPNMKSKLNTIIQGVIDRKWKDTLR